MSIARSRYALAAAVLCISGAGCLSLFGNYQTEDAGIGGAGTGGHGAGAGGQSTSITSGQTGAGGTITTGGAAGSGGICCANTCATVATASAGGAAGSGGKGGASTTASAGGVAGGGAGGTSSTATTGAGGAGGSDGGACVGVDMMVCNGTCVDTATDAANCGGCGQACAANETCNGSACQCNGAPCAAGNTCCGGALCTDIATDPLNCGTCGNPCAANETCSGGMCMCGGALCAAGKTCCNGTTCTDLTADAGNCGACGNDCQAWTCGASVCQPPACNNVGDLSNIGAGDFFISFTLQTTQPDSEIALANQRNVCNDANFWDLLLEDRLINIETDMLVDAGVAALFSVRSCTHPDDGLAHNWVVQRVGGVVTIYIDGKPDAFATCSTLFGQLPTLETKTSPCVNVDGTVVFNNADGTLTNVCVMTSAVQGPMGGRSGGC
jgi:hypothetical protein